MNLMKIKFIPIETLISRFLSHSKKINRWKLSGYKAHHNRLLGSNKNGVVLTILNTLGIQTLHDLNLTALRNFQSYLLTLNLKQTQLNNIVSSFHQFLQWLIDCERTSINKIDLKALRQKNHVSPVPPQIPVNDRKIIRDTSYARSPFIKFRDALIIEFELDYGFRNGKEIILVDLCNFDTTTLSIVFLRKSGHFQRLYLRRDTVQRIIKYIELRRNVLKNHFRELYREEDLVSFHVNSVKPLFIKESPLHHNLDKPEWRLDESALNMQFTTHRKKNRELLHYVPTNMRKTACTNHHLRGGDLNLDKQEVAHNDDHGEEVSSRHYREGIREFAEILTRYPEDLTPFLKRLYIQTYHDFLSGCGNFEDFYTLECIGSLIGKTQLIEKLKTYREKGFTYSKLPTTDEYIKVINNLSYRKDYDSILKYHLMHRLFYSNY